MQSIDFPWSDNWWIEDDKAWFCAGNIGALFCVNMNSQKSELVARIPECDINNFRRYSFCMKYDDSIFCFPNVGQSVWYYDIEKLCWGKIEINKEKQFIMCMDAYRIHPSRAWLIEDETGRRFEVDLVQKVVVKGEEFTCEENAVAIGEYIMADNKLYYASGCTVYCVAGDKVSAYEIPEIKADLYTICYDGSNFWLSGERKEIYIWNPENGIIKIITEFPKQFGFYHFNKDENPYLDCNSLISKEMPFFIHSISLGRYMWYIPFRSNTILYIDKESYEVNLLEPEDEQETRQSIEKNYMGHKYLLQYVRENRYIGVYSFKNQYIFEIDTVELCIIKKNYSLSNKSVMLITNAITYDKQQKNLAEDMKNYDCHRLLKESRERDQVLFFELIKKDAEKKDECLNDIGRYIYHSLNEQ